MSQTRIAVATLLALLLAAPLWAADPSDATEAFRTPAGGTPLVSKGLSNTASGPPAGRAVFVQQAILDRTPVTFHYLPLTQVVQAPAPSGTPAAAPAGEPEEKEPSLTEINKQLSNPVTSLWSLSFQFNNYYLANDRWNNNLLFQPVLPVSLTKEWNLITRPVIPLYNSVPVETAPGQFHQTTAFGDMILLELLSPANSGPWLLGAGPTFIFPTATSKYAGQGKWQAGPSGLIGYLSKEYIIGVFPQQWWSIGGSTDRPYTSQMNLQPFAAWFFAPGWSLGYSGNILANWMAPAGEVWTVPIGLALGKVVKLGRLPIKIQLAGQYMVVHPTNGQEWNIQVQITPVIPKLIKGSLFE